MSRPARPLDDVRELRLLAAAADAFSYAGYEAASLNRIIADAGWAKSSFYHYFPDKQRLHDHVVLTLRDRLASGLRLPDLGSLTADSYWPAMTAVFSSMAATLSDDPQAQLVVRMFHHPLAARGPGGQLTRLRGDVAAWVAQAVGAGQRLGVLRHDVAAGLLANLAVGILTVLAEWAPEHPGELGHWPELATRILLDALSGPDSKESSLDH
jgi:AcrR family transcriptional regulator